MFLLDLTDTNLPFVDKTISANDFVINVDNIDDIVPMSVGVVRKVVGEKATVFFIGKAKKIITNKSLLKVIDISKTGKKKRSKEPPYEYKICNRCHVLKHQNEFAKNQNDGQSRHTTRPTCRECRVQIDGVNLLSSERKRMNKTKPEPHELFKCPICQKVTIPGVTANIVIDHDHRTGKAREWICDSCNTGIGRFQDSPEMLKRIANYIKLHNSNVH